MSKYSLWLTTFSLTVLIAAIFIPTMVISVLPQMPILDVLVGKNWIYTVPFEVHNKLIIEKLIQYESGGANISKPDSDGIVSAGILQFHADGTWQDMERLSGLSGSPLIPSDAILMADWMISHDLGPGGPAGNSWHSTANFFLFHFPKICYYIGC